MGRSNADLLDGLLDLIIPANADGNIPAAGALGVAAFVRENAASDVGLTRLLARATALQQAGMPFDAALVEQLESEEPLGFSLLLRLAYMGYYSRPDTRVLFGLSALPVHPRGYDVPDESPEMMEALVAPVKAREGSFRDC